MLFVIKKVNLFQLCFFASARAAESPPLPAVRLFFELSTLRAAISTSCTGLHILIRPALPNRNSYLYLYMAPMHSLSWSLGFALRDRFFDSPQDRPQDWSFDSSLDRPSGSVLRPPPRITSGIAPQDCSPGSVLRPPPRSAPRDRPPAKDQTSILTSTPEGNSSFIRASMVLGVDE